MANISLCAYCRTNVFPLDFSEILDNGSDMKDVLVKTKELFYHQFQGRSTYQKKHSSGSYRQVLVGLLQSKLRDYTSLSSARV